MSDSFNYSDSFKDAIIGELVSRAFKSILSFLQKKGKGLKNTSPVSFEDRVLKNHFNELYNWSKEIEFIGLTSKPMNTIIKTIQLTYQFSLGKKELVYKEEKFVVKEDDLIYLDGNIIIEGDPGSGKTTTLKRLIYNNFFKEEQPESPFQYPVLIRLRSIREGGNLFTHIASSLGIKYETVEEKYESREFGKNDTINTRIAYYINGDDLATTLTNLLEENNVILIMDGLDEIRPDQFDLYERQIYELGIKLIKSKVIMTSRPNYIKSLHANFSIYQVCPLDLPQIKMISNLWISDADQFLSELSDRSYYELANRPLFLCFLILLYSKKPTGEKLKLPKLSIDVYDEIINLLIKKWDDRRDIRRKSLYADFNENKKIRFLSHLAFRLTYINKEKIFSHKQLVNIYEAICPNFDLPSGESELVAEELENHTGIIIKSLYNKYEFSHLAIQEYLCALYILRAPFDGHIKHYLFEYPPPLALAIALSPDSSAWLTELILRIVHYGTNSDEKTEVFVQVFHRLTIETPYFQVSEELGDALMILSSSCNCRNENFRRNFETFVSGNKNLEQSIRSNIMHYKLVYLRNLGGRIDFTTDSGFLSKSLSLPDTEYFMKLIANDN